MLPKAFRLQKDLGTDSQQERRGLVEKNNITGRKYLFQRFN